MRIARLWLERYGHLAGEALDFPADRTLHVVLGANEAGKSTALEAVADGLFGFTRHSARLRHPDDPRIGLTLQAAGGAAATFVRRRYGKDKLLDPDGTPLPEAALLRFLGGTSRDRFTRIFGLNGERLRREGQAILADHGEAGSAVLQAQVGLHGIREAVDSLDKEAARLFGTAHAKRLIPTTAAAIRDNRQLIAERSLSGADHQAAAKEVATLAHRLDTLRDEAATLGTTRHRLERTRRTAPVRAALAAARAALAELGPPPALPPDAANRHDEARQLAAEAEAGLAADLPQAITLHQQRAALVPDPDILAEAAAIKSLAARRANAEDTAADHLKVSGQALERLGAIDRQAANLGIPERGPALRARIPGTATRTAAGRLVERHAALGGATRAARATLAEAVRAAAAATAASAAHPLPPDAETLRAALDAANAEGAVDQLRADAAALRDATATEAAHALAGLALWSGDAERLAASPVPLDAEATRLAQSLAAATDSLAAASDALLRHAEHLATARHTLEAEERAGPLPQPEAVAALRQRRDAAWHLLRRHLLDATPPPPDSVAALDRLIAEADALADRRTTEVARLQRWEAARNAAAALQSTRPGLLQAQAEAQSRAEAAQAAWRAAWQPAGIDPLAPAAMREWTRDRTAVLEAASRARDAARRHGAVAARHDALRTRLHAALPGTGAPPATSPATSDVATLRAAAARHLKQHDAAAAAHAAAADAARRTAATSAKAAADLADLEAETADWARAWAPVAARLGLSPDAGTELAADTLARWSTLEADLDTWAALDERVRDMEASIARHETARAALAARLGIPDTPRLLPLLEARLATAEATEADAIRLARDHQAVDARIATHRRRAADAAARLDALRHAAGLPPGDDDALRHAIARIARHAQLAADEASRLDELHQLDDGRSEAELAAEAATIDPDAIPASLAEINRRLAEIDAERTEAATTRANAETTLRQMEQGQDVAGPTQQVQDHLATIEDAAHRYVRLRLAHALLRGGIERFRRSQQGPLLAEASRLFAELTAGRYARLEPDETDKGDPVIVAVRPDATTCPADMLSEGTRDQLFLALRLASIRLDAAHAEPLPFIADDLLVNFDDARARAALGLLGRFGTQVILFSHHDHLADLVDPRTASLHRLPREPAA